MPVLCLPLFFVAENPCGDWAVFAFMSGQSVGLFVVLACVA
jgi:hypothetical protein